MTPLRDVRRGAVAQRVVVSRHRQRPCFVPTQDAAAIVDKSTGSLSSSIEDARQVLDAHAGEGRKIFCLQEILLE